MILTGIVISLMFKYLFLHEDRIHHSILIDIIVITLVTVIVWEGNLQIDKWLDKHYSWLRETRKRLLAQVVVSSLFTITMLANLILIVHYILDRNVDNRPQGIDPLFIPAIVIAFGILLINTGSQFFIAWKQSILEVEQYKTESATAQMQNLKKQLNPHFLFNNLSVLSSLVYKDQDKAAEFISELSKVYRYVLDHENIELVTLKNELDFLAHYIYLLGIRFDKGISFSIDIPIDKQQYYLPPMCLQLLVENTIQHNEVSQAKPLQVSIYTRDNNLIVENPIQPRSDKTVSSKTGIKNIEKRYHFFTSEKVVVTESENIFSIALPLILQP